MEKDGIIKNTLSSVIKNIIPYISFIILMIAIIGYAYKAGKSSDRINNVELELSDNGKSDKELKDKVDEQIKVTNAIDAKLGLLLIYFNITDSTRHN